MIRAMIVDDEPAAILILQSLLKPFSHIEVVATADNVQSAILLLNEIEVDLLLLDVEMPEKNGFELLERIDIIDFEVIFTSAYRGFAIKAFKFNAVDYLLKPINVEELKDAIQRVEERLLRKTQRNKMVDGLLLNIVNLHNPFNKVSIPGKEGIVFLDLIDIIRCESDVNYTKVFTRNGAPIISSKPLKQFDELLCRMNFFRIHKSHLINLRHLLGYVRDESSRVIMSDKSELPVSRRSRDAFIKKFSLT